MAANGKIGITIFTIVFKGKVMNSQTCGAMKI
jgi:hypothetical protein